MRRSIGFVGLAVVSAAAVMSATAAHAADGVEPIRPYVSGIVVGYGGRFPAVIEGGLAAAETVIRPGGGPGIVPLPHVGALTLYADQRIRPFMRRPSHVRSSPIRLRQLM